MKLVIGDSDMTQFVSQLVWSGSTEAAARSLEAVLAGAYAGAGSLARLYDGKEELFRGIVTYAERGDKTVTIIMQDYGVYLVKNELYREYAGRPSAIARMIAKQFGIAAGDIAEKPGVVTVAATGDKSAFAVIREAYGAYGTNPQYMVGVDKRSLFVKKTGGSPVAELSGTIKEGRRTDSIEDMVDLVTILKRGGAKKGSVQDAADRKAYGTFGRNYHIEKGTNAFSAAKELLAGRAKGGSVKAVGNTACTSGRAVTVTDKNCGLSGTYTISADRHTFKKGAHEMELMLIEQ